MATILIVDDRREVRNRLQDVLLKSGYSVETANNGREAIDRFETMRPDVVVLDLFMPVMNGFDALLLLRQDHPNAKVIALSGGGESVGMEALEEARHLGAQIALPKPVDDQHLIEAVEELLGN